MKSVQNALLLLAVLLTACVTNKLQAPHLSLVSASMLSADVFAQQFRVRVHVDNPNARELPIKSIDYKLFLEGDSFAEGASQAPYDTTYAFRQQRRPLALAACGHGSASSSVQLRRQRRCRSAVQAKNKIQRNRDGGFGAKIVTLPICE
jgi:hypothetical protein